MILNSQIDRQPYSTIRILTLACFAVVVLPLNASALPQIQSSEEGLANDGSFSNSVKQPVQEQFNEAFSPPASATTVTPAFLQQRQKRVQFTAFVMPAQEATIYARIGAYVEKVHVRSGDRVEKGQVLARLSSEELENEVRIQEAKHAHARALAEQASRSIEAARAGFERARAELNGAVDQLNQMESRLEIRQKMFETVTQLHKQGSVPDTERLQHEIELGFVTSQVTALKSKIEASKASVEQHEALIAEAEAGKRAAEAVIAIAEAELRAAKLKLQHASVRAPFSGIITRSSAVQGMLAARPSDGAKPLFELAAVDTVRVIGQVNVLKLDQIKKGDPVNIAVQNSPTIYGKISRINEIVDATSGTVRVEIDIDNRDRKLRVGTQAKVTVPGSD